MLVPLVIIITVIIIIIILIIQSLSWFSEMFLGKMAEGQLISPRKCLDVFKSTCEVVVLNQIYMYLDVNKVHL